MEDPKQVALDLYRFFRRSGINQPDSTEKMAFLLMTAPKIYPMKLINEILEEISTLERR